MDSYRSPRRLVRPHRSGAWLDSVGKSRLGLRQRQRELLCADAVSFRRWMAICNRDGHRHGSELVEALAIADNVARAGDALRAAEAAGWLVRSARPMPARTQQFFDSGRWYQQADTSCYAEIYGWSVVGGSAGALLYRYEPYLAPTDVGFLTELAAREGLHIGRVGALTETEQDRVYLICCRGRERANGALI